MAASVKKSVSRGEHFRTRRELSPASGRKCDRSDLTLDHVIPRSRGGTSIWTNIVLACVKCNMKKGDKLLSEMSMKLLRNPVKPKWATRVGVKLGRVRKPAWERFLEEAYWNVELKD